MTLKLNGSSSGSVSIDAPASTTGGAAVTLTLPENGFGKLLQVVTATSSTSSQEASANDTWTDIAPTATITPSSTSSRIIIISSATIIITNTQYYGVKLLRGSTGIREWWGYNDNSNWQTINSPPMHIDSPSTTSAITYKFQIWADQNYDDIKWNYNGQNANNRNSEVYLAEIGP